MKGAIVLLLVLLMGFLTARSFEAFGYSSIDLHNQILNQGYTTIDIRAETQPERLALALEKFPTYAQHFPLGSKSSQIMTQLYSYTRQKTPEHILTKHTGGLSPALVLVLSEQF